MRLVSGVLAAIAALSLSACATRSSAFRSDAFQHPTYAYRVVHEHGGSLTSSSDWYVDNYQVDKSGGFTKLKAGPDFQHVIELDSNGDGVAETRQKIASYDLLLRHRKTDGRIWLRSSPISQQLRETSLRTLALDYVNAISGGGSMVVDLQESKITSERRFATRVLNIAEGTLDGQPAYEVTFDIANVDQVQLDPSSLWGRARIVVVRPGFNHHARGADFPVLLFVGYSSRPEDFDRELGAFESVLARVHLMSDNEVIASREQAIFECVPEVAKLMVAVNVDPHGMLAWSGAYAPGEPPARPPAKHIGQTPTCVESALDGVRLKATGRAHSLTVALERGKALRAPAGFARAAPIEL